MFKKQGDAVKEWLQAYRRNEEQIDKQLDRLRTLRARMMSVGAQEISDMPRPPHNARDRMADYVIQAESLEITIQRDIDIQEECRKTIYSLIEKLDKPEERLIIVHRYLYGLDWSDVLYQLYGRDNKYAQNMDSFRRRMYRVHDDALEKMAKKWDKK